MEQAIKNADVKALAVAEFNEFDIKLQEFKEKYIDVIYDLTDEDQEKQAKSDRLAIGKVVSSLDAKHKELKAPLKAETDLIDGERKRIKDDLLSVQDKIKSQIKAHEQKVADHAEMLHDKVEAILLLTDFRPLVVIDAKIIAERLEQAKAHDVDDSYEYRKADATLAHVEAIKTLEALLTDRIKYEAEQVELKRLRKEAADREQAEREERIRNEAAEQATKAAEAEAQRVADVTARKQREEAETAQKAIDDAKRQQLEAEQAAETAAQMERNKIENERLDALERARQIQVAEDKKKANQKHRGKIHSKVKKAFMDNGFDATEADVIVSLIKDGKVKPAKIEY